MGALCLLVAAVGGAWQGAAVAAQDPAGAYSAVWVAADGGIVKLNPQDATPYLTIEALAKPRLLSVDSTRGVLWAVSEDRQLAQFGFDGSTRYLAALPLNHGNDWGLGGLRDSLEQAAKNPWYARFGLTGLFKFLLSLLPSADESIELSERAGLAVNPNDGSAWLTEGDTLYRLGADGSLLNERSLDDEARAIVFDRERETLWIALQDSVIGYGPDGAELVQLELPSRHAQVESISLDPTDGGVWIGTKRDVWLYSPGGAELAHLDLKRLTQGGQLDGLAADGSGNVWLAAHKTSLRMSRTGQVLTQAEPFGRHGTLAGVVADVESAAAWPFGQKALAHIAADGTVVATYESHRGLRDVALSVDRTPPQLSILFPADGGAVSAQTEFKLQYSDVGSGVDPASIAFTVNGEAAAFTCQAGDAEALCVPSGAFGASQFAVGVSVRDRAGNVSAPALVTVKVDSDGDSYADDADAFPNDPAEWADLDKDGLGDNADPDRDGDEVANGEDAFPENPAEWADLDKDGIGNNADPDRDGDEHANDVDIFPEDPAEWADLDTDGTGDNGDSDRDGDQVANGDDLFPENGNEWADLDGDGTGDNGDTDRDGDSYPNEGDAFPEDGNRWRVPMVAITSPATLSTVGASPLTVTGTVDDPAAEVTVNGVPVPLLVNGAFDVQVALVEGFNTVLVRAVDEKGTENTASIVVTLDVTPPNITVQAPADGAVVTSERISVSGLINDIVRGTVAAQQANVVVNGVAATVSNRSYIAEGIALVEGENLITVTGSDNVGNTHSESIRVTYKPVTGARIALVSGQGQRARILATLPEPLTVTLEDANGEPVADKTVVFRVIQGDGVVHDGLGATDRGLIAKTNADGKAAAIFNLGSRAGQGNHRVRAAAVGFDGEVIFHATADPNPGNKLGVIAGNTQRGVVRGQLPSPFVVAVTDSGGNLVAEAPVEFKVTSENAVFQNGEQTLLAYSDTDGRATAHLTLGDKAGMDIYRVTATLVDAGAVAGFTASALEPGDPGKTRISGVVLDNQDKPIPGVTLRVEGTTRQAVSDEQGQFIVTNVPVGPVRLLADASTTPREGQWPTLTYDLVTVAGADNTLSSPVYFLPLNMENAAEVGAEDVVLTLPEVPGFALEVEAGSVTFPDGSKTGKLSVTVVNANKVPMAPPNGMQPQFIVTIQPHGAHFDPPARLNLPNVDGHPAGAEVEMYSYDHDLEEFVTIGWGTVSEDGSVIRSNPGVGVIKAGWHCGSQPGGSGCCGGGGGGGGGGSCGVCQKRQSEDCRDGKCINDDGQDPGECKKCSGGKPVPDDKEKPEAFCKRCSQGKAIADISKQGAECSDDPAKSCYRCKDGECVRDCGAKSEKTIIKQSMNGSASKWFDLFNKAVNKIPYVKSSLSHTYSGELEVGQTCCKDCSDPSPASYEKATGKAEISGSVRVVVPGLGVAFTFYEEATLWGYGYGFELDVALGLMLKAEVKAFASVGVLNTSCSKESDCYPVSGGAKGLFEGGVGGEVTASIKNVEPGVKPATIVALNGEIKSAIQTTAELSATASAGGDHCAASKFCAFYGKVEYVGVVKLSVKFESGHNGEIEQEYLDKSVNVTIMDGGGGCSGG